METGQSPGAALLSARSSTPESNRSGPTPKAIGLTVTMALEELTELQQELQRLRAVERSVNRKTCSEDVNRDSRK